MIGVAFITKIFSVIIYVIFKACAGGKCTSAYACYTVLDGYGFDITAVIIPRGVTGVSVILHLPRTTDGKLTRVGIQRPCKIITFRTAFPLIGFGKGG